MPSTWACENERNSGLGGRPLDMPAEDVPHARAKQAWSELGARPGDCCELLVGWPIGLANLVAVGLGLGPTIGLT